MATRYVSNNPAGSNTSPYDTLAKAALLWGTAITGSAAGDIFAFSNLHSETNAASTTETMPGTAANPNQGFSFDNTQTTLSASDLLTGAKITTTGASSLNLSGTGWLYGLTFVVGTSNSSANLNFGNASATQHYESCSFQLGSTNVGNSINIAGTGASVVSHIEWSNCTIQMSATGQAINGNPGCELVWKNTPNAVLAGTGAAVFPTTLITGFAGTAFLEGVDLSGLPNTSNITSLSGRGAKVYVKDCKIPSGMTVSATPTVYGARTYFTRTDSTGSVNRFDVYDYSGTETQETSITRTAGQADFAGNLWSKKIVTTSNAQFVFPYETEAVSPLNLLTGAVRTVTVFGTINSASLPNNNDIWIEVEYPKDSGDPLGGFVNSTVANPLSTGSAVTADGSSWNGGGSGAGWSPFSLAVSLTAQLKGPLTVRIKAAKASTTYYIDPTPVLS